MAKKSKPTKNPKFSKYGLTKPQVRALRLIRNHPVTVVFWGGKPNSGLPKKTSITTVRALLNKHLLKVKQTDVTTFKYSISKLGQQAAKELEELIYAGKLG